MRAVTRGAGSIFRNNSLWIGGICYAIITLCAPASWTCSIFWNGGFCIGIRNAHVPLRRVPGWAGSIFCDRHDLHKFSPLKNGGGSAVTH